MKNKFKLKEYLSFNLRGLLVTVLALGAASVLCQFLRSVTNSDTHVPMIFVLAVLVVSILTDGYFFGFLASLVSVVGVNFAFTYPYMKLDFTIYGYPLTFFTMLAVGFAVSTLSTRLKAQEKLRAETEREKMRANLLRAISHDLRTPLTAISGSISTVLDDREFLSQEQVDELLLDAKQDADWLYRMVENLLSITRISDDKINSITKEDEILEEVLSEAVMSFRKRHGDVDVSVSVPEEMLFVPMDAMLVEQVLINLLDNAVTHGKSTTRIWISARFVDRMAFISVCNNGQPLPPEVYPHLFDGTLQISSQGKTDNSRFMGIGLSVCRTVVEAHGGYIRAANLPEGGVKFEFTLPLGAEEK